MKTQPNHTQPTALKPTSVKPTSVKPTSVKRASTLQLKRRRKFILDESNMPTHWYNIMADLPYQPEPLLSPKTKEPLTETEMEQLFAKELVKQEFSRERWIEIPPEVRDYYQLYRPTPLIRAYNLEKALDTPAKIFYKNESASPVGSHKLNSAIAQAYYNSKQGIKSVTTETGAGQWGTAMSIACQHFGIDLDVFMVRQSYEQKPYRKEVIATYGGRVHPSPSNLTRYGRECEVKEGSLGIAISEAVEMALESEGCRYTLGSVLNHVILHQTVIGLEAEKQMEMAGYFPDKIIACFGGGSNFAGTIFPFFRHKMGLHYEQELANQPKNEPQCQKDQEAKRNLTFIAAEPAACPKLTKGELRYDYGDSAGMTPLIPMYTLGHDFKPEAIHAAGLRYHGGGQLVSLLKKEGLIDSCSIEQDESFKAGVLFARTEGIIPAPESTHAIAATIREALKAKESGKEEVLLFNLSGHGLLDINFYTGG